MKKTSMKVPFPDEETIQQEIQFIVSKGLDPKPSFWSYLSSLYRQVGFRYLFRDATEILFTFILAAIVLIALFMSMTDLVKLEKINVYTFIFICSPVSFAVLAYFFFIHTKQKPTYEVEMTCKYNLHQIAAFRMLVFAVVSLITNGVLLSFFILQERFHYLFAFLLSSSALFLFAIVLLFAQLHVKSKAIRNVLFFLWVGVNLFCSYYSNEVYVFVLNKIPYYVYGIITLSGLIIYIEKVKKLLFTKNVRRLA
ncbi:hypothetical protein [Bacillus weihaiensis]|uniref:hypothetical protein n=1 Tax=Bacillus weihaiensis TaxID=1547283 RepID=UPI00235305F5|nr:hypothetical protein [Bacillus weihaiensis]